MNTSTIEWIDLDDSSATLPPVTCWLTEKSEKVLVVTPELGEGMGFAYFVHDDEDPHWVTSCANAARLEQVSHYALRPALPERVQ